MRISLEIPNHPERDDTEVNLYLDAEGIQHLIDHLNRLKQQKDGEHLHFMSPCWGRHDLTEDKVLESSCLVHHLRITKKQA